METDRAVLAVLRDPAGLECDVQQESNALAATGKNRAAAACMASPQLKLEPVFCGAWVYQSICGIQLLHRCLGEFQTVRLHRFDAGICFGPGRVVVEVCRREEGKQLTGIATGISNRTVH